MSPTGSLSLGDVQMRHDHTQNETGYSQQSPVKFFQIMLPFLLNVVVKPPLQQHSLSGNFFFNILKRHFKETKGWMADRQQLDSQWWCPY